MSYTVHVFFFFLNAFITPFGKCHIVAGEFFSTYLIQYNEVIFWKLIKVFLIFYQCCPTLLSRLISFYLLINRIIPKFHHFFLYWFFFIFVMNVIILAYISTFLISFLLFSFLTPLKYLYLVLTSMMLYK